MQALEHGLEMGRFLISASLQGDLQTNNRADLSAAVEVIHRVSETADLQFCVD